MKLPMAEISQNIRIAVDAVIFTVRQGELQALLIQMKKQPYQGQWAFPGGLIENQETTEEAARRILEAQTGVKKVYLEQLATFDDPKRDVLGRVLSVVYFALIPDTNVELRTTDKYEDVRWWSMKKLPHLAYDHGHVAKVALARLRAKLEYTNIVWSLLPPEFTLTELQTTYENILGQSLDKRNFRKKILVLNLLEETGKKRTGQRHRPAELYRFTQRKLVQVEIL